MAAAMTALLAVAGCGDISRLSVADGTGAHPRLPEPVHHIIPTMKVARAIGWGAGETPLAAPGLRVNAFATGLEHPRWLYVLPNGDVLVAETNAPPRPDDAKRLKGVFMRMLQKRAGAGMPSANRITLLRDADGDGVAELRSIFIDHLNSPFGMALVGNDLYVADSDALLHFDYARGMTQLQGAGTKIAALPAGTINHHWTKNVIASPDGEHLFVTVGSNSNAGENGLAAEEGRAAIWEYERRSGQGRLFASGLRNPNGMTFVPETGALWAVVNERDELGSDLVPDYMTAVRDGGFYGWPFSYYGSHIDTRVQPQQPARVAQALVPDYALGPHTASLGLAYGTGNALPPAFQHGMFVGQHGSWNRKPVSGYRVIFVPFQAGHPSGVPAEVLTGFLSGKGDAHGRPVGVVLDAHGALLVADDVGNCVWRVTAAANQ